MSDQVQFPGGGGDKLPDQTGETGKYLKSTGTKGSEEWATPGGSGDMEASDYDPTAIVGDAFDMDNMVEGAATLILTDTERAKLAAVAAGADVTGDNAPKAHKASHENAGGDEISVAGLSGELADDQPPKAHAADHENAGGDEISIAGLSGLAADDQHVLDAEVQAVINLAIRTSLQSLMSPSCGPADIEYLVSKELPHFGTRGMMLTAVEYATACSVADNLAHFHVPPWMNGMNLIYAHARVITAGTTGTMTVEVYNTTQTAQMLSTNLTIDTGETGSDTAAAPPVIDLANDHLAENDLITVNVTVLHTTPAEGLIVTLGFQLP